MPGAGRKVKQKVKDEEAEEAEEKEEEEPVDVVEEEPQPVTYRWISSKKVDGGSSQMVLSFSVPPTAMPTPPLNPGQSQPKAPSSCAVEGCSRPRKYRLVKDWTIGACGMPHLKSLDG